MAHRDAARIVARGGRGGNTARELRDVGDDRVVHLQPTAFGKVDGGERDEGLGNRGERVHRRGAGRDLLRIPTREAKAADAYRPLAAYHREHDAW
jgi:hypothetical protein